MSRELELAGGMAAGGWLKWRRKHADIPPGTPCANCETALQGPYCHACGQVAEDFHKSIWKLFVESIESFFHFDGRLWKTLPDLTLRPGRLTRSYLDGKRASQIPPFRLFLVILLIVFFVGHQTSSGKVEKAQASDGPTSVREQVRRGIETDKELTPAEKAEALEAMNSVDRVLKIDPVEGAPDMQASRRLEIGDAKTASAIQHWMEERAKAIQEDPERFLLILEIWAHRVAVLALPVSALLLTLLFVFQRRFFVFDHLVFSMHSLSFQLLLLTTILLVSALVGPVAWWLLLAMPVHLFAHMRGVYATGVFGTVLRMTLLAWGTVIGFSLLAMLWLYLGVNQMGGH
ncbi:MAG TPA: DUF3667 domain-containing protein [Caulobacteraceae bacterium]|nr:DUF3667 domain-containing protein [Caulobacteraceae bacterium]